MMNQTIYDFLCNYLTEMRIPFHASVSNDSLMPDLDMGLRNSILKGYQRETVSSLADFNPQVLYHFSDYYNCNYTFFRMPDKQFFYIGPYLLKDMTDSDIHQLITAMDIPESHFSQLQDYYYGLPLIKDRTAFYSLMRQSYQAICEIEVPVEESFDLRTLESREEYLRKHTFVLSDDPVLSMNMLEKRYISEDEFLEAVSQGNTTKALAIIGHMGDIRISSRADDELRDRKNLMLALNTVLRRTTYSAGVHPFYIDAISANYARFIETATGFQELEDVLPYLVRSYCDLVKKRSTALYSAPVRQILVTIDASINGDLSLKRFANELFLNTSYLSSLFKKETGMTLTDYVNQHRINFAKRLLKSTTLSIQAVATAVGIPDIHYFTRLFRRETGYSPREYRKL